MTATAIKLHFMQCDAHVYGSILLVLKFLEVRGGSSMTKEQKMKNPMAHATAD